MFDVSAYQNPYLREGETKLQAVLSINLTADVQSSKPVPLALGIIIDRSGSMEGPKIEAAKDAAIRVIQAADESTAFMVVTFNEVANVIVPPSAATPDNKMRAIQSIRNIYTNGGTCMSTGLAMVAREMITAQGRARKILFLTDGKNEGEKRNILDRAVYQCQQAQVEVSAWGIGTDWDENELRYIADGTHGEADIIPSPDQVTSAFSYAFQRFQTTTLTDVKLNLWTPQGVTIQSIQQVFPQIAPLQAMQDPVNLRISQASLGSWAQGDQRDYLVDFQIPSYTPGQQFLMARPSLVYTPSGRGEEEEKTERKAWIFAQWTTDLQLAAQIDQHVAHYTNQEELSQNIREGQAALAVGDNERATRLLGRALQLSQQTGNENMTRMLNKLVVSEPNGTVRLNKNASAVERKTIAINSGKTTRLK
ncbi:MAG TPA: vWA domain-containing protein [Chloroflexia bacterium]|nr:vWA domain-containing protein [Chloroflexia bacterium]